MKIVNKLKELKSLRMQSLGIILLIGLIPVVLFSLILTNAYRGSESKNNRVADKRNDHMQFDHFFRFFC